ncbi:MAG: hypothetical protein ACPGR8_06930 [Limisphaerales bacterium]
MGVIGQLTEQAALLPSKLLSYGFLFGTIAGVGLALVLLRISFMEAAPWLARHAHLTTALVNGVIDFIWLMFTQISVCFQVIEDAVRLLEGKKATFTVKPPPNQLSSAQVEHFLQTVPVLCNDFVWGNRELIQWPLQRALSPTLCPVLRFLWPLSFSWPGIYSASDSVLGWASVDPTPVAGGNNCEPDDGNKWICVGFGMGYLILEVLLPALVLFMLLWPFIIILLATLFKFAFRVVHLAEVLVTRALKAITMVGRAAEDAL